MTDWTIDTGSSDPGERCYDGLPRVLPLALIGALGLQQQAAGDRPDPWAFSAVTACGPEGRSRADMPRSAV
jgi:hypothetical protein